MSKSDFDAFVERQQAKQKQDAAVFDPKKQLEEWLGYLDALYREIEKYLEGYLQAGAARVEYFEIPLNEEFIGSYIARKMFLRIGHSTVSFTPIGTMLIGTKGRVDVQGPLGGVRLGLVNKKVTSASQLVQVSITVEGQPKPSKQVSNDTQRIEWVWKFITAPPEMRFIDLTQQSFFDTIVKIADA